MLQLLDVQNYILDNELETGIHVPHGLCKFHRKSIPLEEEQFLIHIEVGNVEHSLPIHSIQRGSELCEKHD